MRRTLLATIVLAVSFAAAAPAAAQSESAAPALPSAESPDGRTPAQLTESYVSASALLLAEVAAPESAPVDEAAFRKGSLTRHMVWGGVIGAGVGLVLAAMIDPIACWGGEGCGNEPYVRGAVIFGAMGAATGALVYGLRK